MKNILLLLLLFPLVSFGQTAEEFFDSGMEKRDLKDYYGAISDFNKAIEISPYDTDLYFLRGDSKESLKDYNGAMVDYSKMIELDDIDGYYFRGTLKDKTEDYYGAIGDFTMSIDLNDSDPKSSEDLADSYSYRGVTKEKLGDLSGACVDWRKAASLGDTDSREWVIEQCGSINNSITAELSIIGAIVTQKKKKGISGILIYVNGIYVTSSNSEGYYKLKAKIGDAILFKGKRIGRLIVTVPKEFKSNKDNVIGVESYSSIVEKLAWPTDVNGKQRLDWK